MSTLATLIISDLHTEAQRDNGKTCIEDLDDDADVVIVAGDLGTKHTITTALQRLCDKYPDVVYVHGNHELYRNPSVHFQYQIHAVKRNNLHWLNNSMTTIRGVPFVGTTLWFPETHDWLSSAVYMSDFYTIPAFSRWVFKENARAVQYLADTVTPESVVVTHHLPSMQSVHEMYVNDHLTRFFVCPEAESIIRQNNPQVWAHGHTHTSCDYIHEGSDTHVICNPYGYQQLDELNPDFDFNKKIKIICPKT